MQIFRQEIADGLEQTIKTQASISYASVAEPSTASNHNIKNIKSIAGLQDSDLYYVQSILVSSSWNKNDDIFDKAEVWAAKNTPEDKPTNLNHDENIIIGHITSNWPITDDGMIIDENTLVENLPDKFHILTGSVIYKGYTSPELRDRTTALIEEIENGTKYVSMECFFKGFDYGLIDKSSGEYKVLARNEETAYLSKYLRAYGGYGEHDNYKIGRVLRKITFSGKGYVDKPANPDSIILNGINNLKMENKENIQAQEITESEKNHFSENSGVIANEITRINTETIQMNEDTKSVAELEETIKAKQAELEIALAAITQCEAEAAEKTEQMKKKEEEMMKKEEEMNKMKAELDATTEVIAAYKSKEEEMMKKEKKNKRMASLLEAGIETAEAELVLEKFETVDDSAFEAMTVLLAAKKVTKDSTEEPKKEKAETKSVEETVLETVEEDTSAIDLAVGGSDDTQVESTRAALIDFVYSRLGKKQTQKGE